MSKKIVLTGIQPTASGLHLGNYFGAIKPLVDMQNDENTLYAFVADLHAITNPDIKLNPDNKKNLICTYVAAGVDPLKTILFYQSDVPAHTQLGWVLICSTTYGELSRMTQFKDKSTKFSKANGTASIPTGLLVYPPLMSADILLYDTDFVPVGIDQKQHVELTRNIAERFNNKYGNTFVLPSAQILKESAKIFDLQDPTKKMSKSASNQNGVIYLNDSIDTITKKIKTALTDNYNQVKYDREKQPAISNLITVYSLLSGMAISEIEKKFSKISNYGEFKNELTNVVINWFEKFNVSFNKAQQQYDVLEKIINNNAKKCQEIAGKKVKEVYKKIGLSY